MKYIFFNALINEKSRDYLSMISKLLETPP